MSTSIQTRLPAFETEFVNIPKTQLNVSRVALGTWAMGGWMWGGTDRRESVATIQAALDQGINLIDTAPVYGFGVSEEIVGAALKGRRNRAVIATKTGIEWRDGRCLARLRRTGNSASPTRTIPLFSARMLDIESRRWFSFRWLSRRLKTRRRKRSSRWRRASG